MGHASAGRLSDRMCLVARLRPSSHHVVAADVFSSFKGLSPQALNLSGEARFNTWHLRRLIFEECRRGLRRFWESWVCLGNGPKPETTLKRPCTALVRLVGRTTSTVYLSAWLIKIIKVCGGHSSRWIGVLGSIDYPQVHCHYFQVHPHSERKYRLGSLFLRQID